MNLFVGKRFRIFLLEKDSEVVTSMFQLFVILFIRRVISKTKEKDKSKIYYLEHLMFFVNILLNPK